MKNVRKETRPDIMFTTLKGLNVKLVFDKEYRAFKHVSGGWAPMALGGSDGESLKAYIMENF